MASTTSADTNMAAYLDKPGAALTVREALIPEPGPDELVLRVHSLAINPTDAIRCKVGMGIPEDGYPHIVGCDGAGIVHSLGSSIVDFKIGDRIIAMSDEFFCLQKSHGMFQRYVVVDSKHACKIPDGLSYDDACVLPLCMATAAGAVFEHESMNLDWPWLQGEKEFKDQQKKHTGEVVVIWGGSSSVGLCATQMIRDAGYRVIATASKRNFDLCKTAGAEAVFDHTHDDCIDTICKWVGEKGAKSAGVFPVVIDPASFERCGQIAKRLPGQRLVGTTSARGLMPLPELGEDIKVTACKFTSFHFGSTNTIKVLRCNKLICSNIYGRAISHKPSHRIN